MNKKTVRDIPVENKKVLVRVDYNVPLKDGKVQDDTRIRLSLPTIRYLLERNANLVLISHLGRPKGEKKEELKLDPVAEKLEELLGKKVTKVDEVVGDRVAGVVNSLSQGEVLLLENVRFEPGEEKNDPGLAKQLSRLGEIYVNDAFGTAHRAHASTEGITGFLPSVAGLLLEKEVDTLQGCLEEPRRPLTVVMGGAKVSDKLGVIKRFLQTADYLLIGGGMANTFLVAQGYSPGSSFYEEDSLEDARELLGLFEQSRARVYLPRDLVAADSVEEGASQREVPVNSLSGEDRAVDVGSSTMEVYEEVIRKSEMIVWNGPLGVFEVPPFHRGTEILARAAVDSRAFLLLGGGDTVSAFENLNLIQGVDYVSTGGGATLEFWEKGDLPGIKALQDMYS